MTGGTFTLVKYGGVPIVLGDAMRAPWWWAYVVMYEERMRGIQSAAAYDPDKLSAPKALWVAKRQKELDDWYKSREGEKNRPRVLD